MLTRIFLLVSFLLIVLLRTAEVCAQIAGPPGIAGWWAGDGDGRDISANALNGTLINSNYGICKVGQCFDLRATTGAVPHLQIPDNAALRPAQFTIEAWVKFTPTFDDYAVAIAKGYGTGFLDSYALATSPSIANPQFFTAHNGASHQLSAPTNLANPNSWNHLAASYDGVTKRLYVNGSLVATAVVNLPISYDVNPAPLTIGADWENSVPSYRFNGFVDEPTLYNRALSDGEISAVFNAGVGGKIKSAATAAGANSQSIVNDATITFQNVSIAGTTSDYTLDPATLPAIPLITTHTGLAYEISTTATYQSGAADNVRVCFNVPALSSVNFGLYRVLHLEGGNWFNRTDSASVYPNLCTDNLTSLSPFAIVQAPTTAANVAISGRVMTSNGEGIRGARLTLTSPTGAQRTAISSSFGYYRFDDVEAGRTYVLEIGSRRFTFADPTRIFNLQDELTGIDFTAEPR